MAEFVEAILAQLIGNLSTALIILIFYFNFLLFESYLRLIVWAILFSQALRQAKNNVISVLQYLSDDPDVDKYGFLTCVFSKSCEIFLYHPQGSRRSAKELFLNYGIFVFSLIGAVSIWMRMYSWMSFLHMGIGVWILLLSLIKILDRRIFYYRYFISDEVLVSSLLILGFFITGIFVMFYLGTESYMEGSRAAADLSNWVQKSFINDERTREIWSEQVENSRAMISAALTGIEDNYNETMWWPPVKSLVKTYYLDAKAGDTNLTTAGPLYTKFSLPENMTLFQVVSLAYSKVDSVNLTSVQLTDWTSKGLEVSSIAFGSVAQLIFLVFTLIIAFVSLGIRAFFFISSLFYLLCTNWDPIERFVEDLLPIQPDKRPQVVHSLRKVVEGVFFLPLKMSSLHALVTLVSFTIVNADFVYLATTFTFFISIVPIIPPYLVCLPWVVSIWVTSSFVKAIALFGVQYFAFTVLDDMLYEKSIVALNSYVSALSVVFGVYVFGFEGVIFGPLSVCAVTFAYDVSNHGIQAAHNQDDYNRTSEDLRDSDHEDVGGDDAAGSSFGEDDDPAKEDDAETIPDEVRSPSTIFSNAMYRVISGPLVDRVRRRLSMDITTEDSVCVSLVVEGLKAPRKVRFVVNKTWGQRALYENLRRMLRVHTIEGLTASDGSEVLSPLHIFPNEVLHVRVRPKNRPPLFPESTSTISPRYRRAVNSATSPGPSGTASPAQLVSPTKGKKGMTVALPLGSTMSAKQARARLRRQHSVPIHGDGNSGLRRRGSYSIGSTYSSSDEAFRNDIGAATYEDISSMLSTRNLDGGTTLRQSSRSTSPAPPVSDTSPKREGILSSRRTDTLRSGSSTPTYTSPKRDRPIRPSIPPTPVAFDGSGSLDGDHDKPKKINLFSQDESEVSPEHSTPAGRRKSVQLLRGSTSLLFSPLSVQDGSQSFPSDDDDDQDAESKQTNPDADYVDVSQVTDLKDTGDKKASPSTPTKTLCFDDVKDTADHDPTQPVPKFKYVSKAKAQQYRQKNFPLGLAMEFEEASLLQKVCALYNQISSLASLEPSKNVDTLFTQLVLTCSPPAPGLDIASLSQPLQAMRAHLIRLCAKAEALLELHFSSILASSFDNPISNLSIFPYYSNYLKLSLLEFDILRSHYRRVPATVAFLGSGPLPLSSIVLASIHLKGTIFHNFDIDPAANTMASQLVCSDPDLSQRMIFHTTDVMEVTKGLKDYEVVFLAALVGLEEEEKGRVLRHLGKHMAAGAYLMLRSAHGARAFLYPVVDICNVEASGFEILSVFHPTDEVINSVVIARKKLVFDRNSIEDEDDDEDDEKQGILVNTSSIVLPEKCSGFNGFSPMIEEQLS